MTDDFGSDTEPVAGENAGYVPCLEEAAALASPAEDANAVAGDAVGRVPDETAAASLSDDDDAYALAGSEVGFVAKPCSENCQGKDTFTRSVPVGLGTSEFPGTPLWVSDSGSSGLSVDGSAARIDISDLIALDAAQAHVPLSLSFPIEFTCDVTLSGTDPTATIFVSNEPLPLTPPTGSSAEFFIKVDDVLNTQTRFRLQKVRNALGSSVNYVAINEGTVGVLLHLRGRITQDEVFGKLWKDGDAEPAAFLGPVGTGLPDFPTLSIWGVQCGVVPGGGLTDHLILDNLCIVSGL